MTHLCIDFGTSSTVAVLAGPQGVRPVLFDGGPSLPSGVCADPTGRLLTGRDAAHAARSAPERYEPYPKQHIDERSVLLGGVEVAVPDLIAAVLRRVVAQLPAPPQRVTLTHPAVWGAQRREVLWEAAARAGLGSVRLVGEPVAAAAHYAASAAGAVPAGGSVLVCDIGAATVDTSVVRRTPAGFEVLATAGLTDGGGLDLDAAIVAHLGSVYAPRNGGAWQRLTAPATPGDRIASRAFWSGVRAGKEQLSGSSATHIHLPILEVEAPLGREQFEQLARPVVERAVTSARAVLREARVEPSALHGVFLAGGGTRVPLVASMLHRALGPAPRAAEQRELAVALGAVTAEDLSGPDLELTVKAARPAERTKVYAAAQIPVRKPPKRRDRSKRRRRLMIAGAFLAAALAGGGAAYAWPDGSATGEGSYLEFPENDWDGEFGMQIADAVVDERTGERGITVREENGGTYLLVRVDPAAEVWLPDNSASSVDELFTDLGNRPAGTEDEAFDVTFDSSGTVTEVHWRYAPPE